MIHARCRGSPSTKSVREYKTVKEEDFKSYSKNKSISSSGHMNRTDLYLDFNLAN